MSCTHYDVNRNIPFFPFLFQHNYIVFLSFSLVLSRCLSTKVFFVFFHVLAFVYRYRTSDEIRTIHRRFSSN